MKLPRRRSSRPRGAARLAPVGDIPDSSDAAAEAITAVEPTWNGNMYVFEGASGVGLPDGETAAVLPEWWRP